MFCPKCNNKIQKDFKVCPSCGTNLEELKKEKKEKFKSKLFKVKSIIAIILILFFVIFTTIVVSINFFNKNKNKKEFVSITNENEEPTYVEIDEADLIYEYGEFDYTLTDENRDTDDDEDGLTFEEEINNNTNPYIYDSDGDNLSDGEEINRYKSDPNKYSTSDDGISDYTKAMLNLDFSKVYSESEIKKILEDDEVNYKVTLIPSTLDAQVKGKFEEFTVDSTVNAIEKTFSVYGFEGQIKYELDSSKKVVLLVEFGGEYTEFDDYEIDGDTLIINIDEDDNAKDFVITTSSDFKAYKNDKGGNDE